MASNARFLERARIAATTVVGPGHDRAGLPNQDAFACVWSQSVLGKVLVIAIADGLGSASQSREGAHRAVQLAVDVALERVQGKQTNDALQLADEISQAIIARWHAEHTQDSTDYDTTLLFTVVTPDNCIMGQVGDGLILYEMEGDGISDFETFVEQEKEYLNQPPGTLAGVRGKKETFHVADVAERIKGNLKNLILMTDGVADDLADPRAYARSLVDGLAARSNISWNEQIEEHLRSWPRPGHYDDKTVIVVSISGQPADRKGGVSEIEADQLARESPGAPSSEIAGGRSQQSDPASTTTTHEYHANSSKELVDGLDRIADHLSQGFQAIYYALERIFQELHELDNSARKKDDKSSEVVAQNQPSPVEATRPTTSVSHHPQTADKKSLGKNRSWLRRFWPW
jgi:serine/threonine protein phosphatase PrpC